MTVKYEIIYPDKIYINKSDTIKVHAKSKDNAAIEIEKLKKIYKDKGYKVGHETFKVDV